MEITLEELTLPDYIDLPNPPYPIALQFEDDIPADSMVINVKLNFEAGDDIKEALRELPVMDIRNYVQDLGCEILFSTIGYHLNGDHKQPHIHYHFITTSFKQPSNLSQHRKRWINKNEDASRTFLQCSFKFQDLDLKKAKYSTLSYPFKERTPYPFYNKMLQIYNKEPMTKEQMQYLVDVGSAIYEKEIGTKLRQEKCLERKKQSLLDLSELLTQNKDQFSTYIEMVRWLDINYISQLSLEDYPDPKNYKTNCQKIAINLGKLKYSDIL